MSEKTIAKLKQKVETANLIRTVFLCDKVDLVKYGQTKYIKLDDVLKILEVEQEKLRELADLLKNRPKATPHRYAYGSDYEEWFEVYEKKFALLFGNEED